MKTGLLALLLVLVVSSALVAAPPTSGASTFTSKDSLSYAIGVNRSNVFRTLEGPPALDLSLLIQAINDGYSGTPLISEDEAREFIADYFYERMPQMNRVASAQYLDSVMRNNPNVHRTESGLIYEMICPGSRHRPKRHTDTVTLKLAFQLDLNKELEAPWESQPIPLHYVVSGLEEGLRLIGTGGKIYLWIPSDLAYGERGAFNVGRNCAIYVEAELLEVKRARRER